MINMFLPLKPTPKQRPRFSNGRAYTPEKTKEAERDIVLFVNNYMRQNGIKITDRPLSVSLSFNFVSKKEFSAKDSYHIKKPDLDNLAKTVLDAMNNLVYLDDSQVCKLFVEKNYDSIEGIFLKVEEL